MDTLRAVGEVVRSLTVGWTLSDKEEHR